MMMRRLLALTIGGAVLGAVAVVGIWMLLQADRREPPAVAPAPGATAPPPSVQVLRPIADLAPAPAQQGEPTAGVAGIVLADDRPVSGATVELFRQLSGWPEWRRERIDGAITGVDGTFRFRVERGPGLLIAFDHPLGAGDLIEAPPALEQLVLRLRRGFELTGLVTNDRGLPMAGVQVALESTLADTRLARPTVTTSNGTFRFTKVPGGTVRVVARHEFWQPAVLPAVSIGVDNALRLRFEKLGLALEGTVVAAGTLEPVADVEVLALPQGQQIGRHDPFRAATRADGRFRIAGLPRGNLNLQFRHQDHAVVSRALVVGPAAAPLTIELPPRCTVAGRLLPAAGAALPGGARLVLRGADNELLLTTVQHDGTFLFARRASPGWADLSVADRRFAFVRSSSQSLRLRLDEGVSEDLQLEVGPPAIVRGRIVDADAAAIVGARVSVKQTEQAAERLLQVGNALLERDLGKVGEQFTRSGVAEPEYLLAASGSDGRFEIAGLPPGRVSLRIEHAGHGSRRLEVEVPPSGQQLEIEDALLPPACRILGQVLRGGRPLAGAQVGVVAAGLQITAVTDLNGRYELADLPPGDYRVRARYSTLPTVVGELVSAAPERPARVELTFPAGRMLRGTVVGAVGQPVEGAMVLISGVGGAPAVTDSSGQFVIEAPERDLELQVLHGDRGARDVEPVAAGAEHVTIKIDAPPKSAVTAQVLGLPGRKELTGVQLRIARPGLDDDPTSVQSRWIELQNGHLRHAWLPAGQWRLTIWCEGYAPFVRELELRGGEELALGEILLEPGCLLVGRVVDEDGAPVQGAQVMLGDEVDLDAFDPAVRSGPDGGFAVRGVSTAANQLVVRAAGFAVQTQPLSLPQDVLGKRSLEVRLERGATIEVVMAAGSAAAGSIVVLRRQGRVLAIAEVEDDGRARFANCGLGDYAVQRFGEGAPVRVQVVRSGQVVRSELQ